MGTWGTKAFDNDEARDWLAALFESRDLSIIDRTLKTVIATKDYLEAPESQAAIAAAEVVARLQGRPDPDGAEEKELHAWIAGIPAKPDSRLAGTARDAIDRIVTAPSELLELWQDSDDYDTWRTSVQSLRTRISD